MAYLAVGAKSYKVGYWENPVAYNTCYQRVGGTMIGPLLCKFGDRLMQEEYFPKTNEQSLLSTQFF